MKARRRDDHSGPLTEVESLVLSLPDPEPSGDADAYFVGKGCSIIDGLVTITRGGITFRRVPTTDRSEIDGATYWKWEAVK